MTVLEEQINVSEELFDAYPGINLLVQCMQVPFNMLYISC